MVKMNGQDYHYPDEPGAVMFALRHSRDLATTATVYDPDGRVVTQFGPREYDLRKHGPKYTLQANEDLQVGIARARSSPASPAKATGKRPLRKKAS